MIKFFQIFLKLLIFSIYVNQNIISKLKSKLNVTSIIQFILMFTGVCQTHYEFTLYYYNF
jgi:hypothetical protein